MSKALGSCYEHNTCDSIRYNNRTFSDAEAKEEFLICTREEINNLLSQKENKKNIDNKNNLIRIIMNQIHHFLSKVVFTYLSRKANLKSIISQNLVLILNSKLEVLNLY